MAKRLAALALVFAISAASPAVACEVVIDHPPDYWEQLDKAKATIAAATAIFDGEVVEVNGGIAKVRAYRHFKGEPRDYYLVGYYNSCDIMFDKVGERWRFVLLGGPEYFHTYEDYSNARAIDKLLKSDRRKDWPLVVAKP
jgi:hypothetical protein